MKKIFLCAALLAASSMSFAQEAKVKEAKSLASSKNYAGAVQAIAAAIADPSTANSAETYAVAGDIYDQMMSEQYAKKSLKQQYDEKAYSDGLLGMYANYVKCYVLDNQPNEKGKIKPKFSKGYPDKLWNYRGELINMGIEGFNKQDYAGAFKMFATYVDTFTSPMFANDEKAKNDTLITYNAALATLAAEQAKDYNNVLKYADLGMKDKNKDNVKKSLLCKMDASQKLNKDEDYINAVKQGIELFPEEQTFAGNLFQYFLNKKDSVGAQKFVDELVAKNPNSSYNLFLKGYLLMNQKKYDEAIEAFNASKAIDPKFTNNYSCIAQSAINKAQEYSQAKDFNQSKYLTILKPAIDALESWKGLAPKEAKSWGPTLYRIYYVLNNAKIPEYDKKMADLKTELQAAGVNVE